MRLDSWFANRYGYPRWVAIYLWPSLEIKWLPQNQSLHFELNWIVWEAWLGIFWNDPQP
jgi:hypothetical protein